MPLRPVIQNRLALCTSSPKNLTDQSSKAIIGASSVVVRVKILVVEKGAQAAAGMKP